MTEQAKHTAGPSFERTHWEDGMARKLAARAIEMERKHGGRPRSHTDWWMDFIATHANGNPLDFDKLAAADDFNFAHDAFGIARHLDRETGQLRDFFSPRCSARAAKAEGR